MEVVFEDIHKVSEALHEGKFLFAFYQAYRKPQMFEPKNPTKPEFSHIRYVRDTATSQFLNFLSDLKIQEALARNEKQLKDAEHIAEWFVDFEKSF